MANDSNLEYLVVGIAKNNHEDLVAFYDKTHVAAYIFALALTGDKNLARAAAVEGYKRVIANAKEFDTDISAEYWLLDIISNLCTNGLCDGEIAKMAESKLIDNLTHLSAAALFDTDEDRGKMIALRAASGLSKSQVAQLLWYNIASANGEYKRGLVQAAKIADERAGNGIDTAKKKYKTKEIAAEMKANFKEETPDYFELIEQNAETAFSKITEEALYMTEEDRANPGESQEARKTRVKAEQAQKRKKKTIILLSVIGVIVVGLAIFLTIYFVNKRETALKEAETYDIVEPLHAASIDCIEEGGVLYFGNYKDGGYLSKYDIATGKTTRISEAIPKDFYKYNGKIYFRNSNNGRLSFIDIESGAVTEADFKGGLPVAYKDKIFFSGQSGICSCDYDLTADSYNLEYEITGSTYRYMMSTEGDSLIFSAAPTAGLFQLSYSEEAYVLQSSLTDYVIYDFKIYNGYFIFENAGGTLYFINLGDGEGKNVITRSDVLKTSAFTICDGKIYYVGEEGIYAESLDNIIAGEENGAELVLKVTDNIDNLADLYVTPDNIYVYFSNGDKDTPYNELVCVKNGAEIGSAKTIFKVK